MQSTTADGATLVADGSVNPNDIPDDVAIRHFLLRLSAMYDRDAGNMSHEAATEFTLSVAQHTKAGADLLAFLDPYVTEFRSLNNDALATKDVSVLKALAEKRQQLFKHLLSDVDTRLDATLKGLVHVYLQTQVTPNIKIYR